MIVECPECSTKFSIEARLLGLENRIVRCSKCSHQWHTNASREDILKEREEKKILDSSNINEDENKKDFDSFVEEANKDISGNIDDSEHHEGVSIVNSEDAGKEIIDILNDNIVIDKKFVFLSFSVFFLMTVIVFLLFSEKIIKVFPQTYSVYKALGFVHSPLVLHPVDAEYKEDHYGNNILYIELEVENITNKPQVLSPINVGIYDDKNILLKHWLVPPSRGELEKKSSKLLKFGLKNAPEGGNKVVISRNLKKIYGIIDQEIEQNLSQKPHNKADNKDSKKDEEKTNDKSDGGHH